MPERRRQRSRGAPLVALLGAMSRQALAYWERDSIARVAAVPSSDGPTRHKEDEAHEQQLH